MAQTDYVIRILGKDDLSKVLANVKTNLKSTGVIAERLTTNSVNSRVSMKAQPLQRGKAESGEPDIPLISQPQTSSFKKRNKGGRPKLEPERKKRYGVKVYFEEENYNKLVWKSSVCNLPISRIIIEFAVNGYVKKPFQQRFFP